jgi:hypothetical protein
MMHAFIVFIASATLLHTALPALATSLVRESRPYGFASSSGDHELIHLSPAAGTKCGEATSQIIQALRNVAYAQDQSGAFHGLFEQSYALFQLCPDSEPIAYALARSTELGFARLPIEIDGLRMTSAVEIVAQLAVRHTRSARIATIHARQLSTVESADAALAIDPSYAPAKLALAAAKTGAGQPKAALTILKDIKNVATLPGFHTVRARSLLADGDSSAAANEARSDINGHWAEPIEPLLMLAVRRDAEETLGRALLATGKRAQATRHLRVAAGLGSHSAEDAITQLRD